MLTTADRSSKNRSLYSSLVGCVSVRSLCVFDHWLFLVILERFGGLPLSERMPFTAAISRTTTCVHPRSKVTRVGTLKGRKAMKGPFDDHVWQRRVGHFWCLSPWSRHPKSCSAHARTVHPSRELPRDWYIFCIGNFFFLYVISSVSLPMESDCLSTACQSLTFFQVK